MSSIVALNRAWRDFRAWYTTTMFLSMHPFLVKYIQQWLYAKRLYRSCFAWAYIWKIQSTGQVYGLLVQQQQVKATVSLEVSALSIAKHRTNPRITDVIVASLTIQPACCGICKLCFQGLGRRQKGLDPQIEICYICIEAICSPGASILSSEYSSRPVVEYAISLESRNIRTVTLSNTLC